ncbi:hypothetical protein [Planomonospora parontospora]|uniref:hypothetical protein n=1 Tax=Planomonospora parontospora TaxID=58119 RepID=UPI0027E507E7|nr:hypothetical protein [Planomonospora parontospora]
MAATPTRTRLGRAALTRSGVGPASNRAVSTPVVASRPNAVKTPLSRLSAIVVAVSRGLASQASRTAWATRAGSRRATVRNPTPTSLSACAYQSVRLISPSSGTPGPSVPVPVPVPVPVSGTRESVPGVRGPGARDSAVFGQG